jgi:hypothetical protein
MAIVARVVAAAEALLEQVAAGSAGGPQREPATVVTDEQQLAHALAAFERALPPASTTAEQLVALAPELVALRVVLRALDGTVGAPPNDVFVSECISAVAARVEQQRAAIESYQHEALDAARTAIDTNVLDAVCVPLDAALQASQQRARALAERRGWVVGRTESQSADLGRQLRDLQRIATHAELLAGADQRPDQAIS